jgi:tetratricopeptide (TPR) repeat protein
LREKGRLYEAKKEARVALRIEPSNSYALSTLGDILVDDGSPKEAESVYKEALEKLEAIESPSKSEVESEIHNSIGWIYVQDSKYKEAEKEFKESIRFNYNNKNARENLNLLKRAIALPRTAPAQIAISIVLLMPLGMSYIFLYKKIISYTVFLAQSTLLIALILVVLFIQHIGSFKVAEVEFKMSEQSYAFTQTKPSEMKRK